MSSPRTHPRAVIVPVKPPAEAKSRLAGLPDEVRRALAAAFAVDTVAAALAADAISRALVVTDDASFASHIRATTRCDVLPDGASGDLNAALVQAALEASRRWPDLQPVALCADLPALRPADLDAALAWVDAGAADDAARPAFVADAAGTGTTLYAAPTAGFSPRFGAGSREAHLAAGAREVSGPLPTLRQDVDDAGDLGRALLLGVGPRTAAAWGHDEGGSPALE